MPRDPGDGTNWDAAGDILQISRMYREALLREERSAAAEIIQAYRWTYDRIQVTLTDLLAKYEEARRNEDQDALDRIYYRIQRADALQAQVMEELIRFGDTANSVITNAQWRVVLLGLNSAEELTGAALGPNAALVMASFDRVPVEAMMDLVGFTYNGSPLRTLFDALGAETSEAMRSTLLTGFAQGYNPRKIAREMRAATGIGLDRALRISRTETIRAYREATRRSYAANTHIIAGWIWHSAADTRTCAACWGMHGSVHPPDEVLNDHCNGRCVALPQTKTWEELGFSGLPETQVNIEAGEDRFAKLDSAAQEKILGPAKYRAYKDGAITLQDLVGIQYSREWGASRYEKSLSSVLGPDLAAKYRHK